MLNNFADVADIGIGELTVVQSSNVGAKLLLLILICLVFTIIFELLFAFIFKVRKRNLWIVVLAQVVTNPIVVLVSNLIYYYAGIGEKGFLYGLVIMEFAAFYVEGLMYKYFFDDYKFFNPFLLSFLLNLLSFVIGWILLSFWYWQ